jgi:hypothetical protein
MSGLTIPGKMAKISHVMLETPCLSRQGLRMRRAAKEMLVEELKFSPNVAQMPQRGDSTPCLAMRTEYRIIGPAGGPSSIGYAESTWRLEELEIIQQVSLYLGVA